MTKSDDFHGVICPIITPFDNNDRIDNDSLNSLIEYIIEGGVHGVMVAGTTGEGMLLSIEERRHLTETVISQVAGRAKVIVHVGCIDTPTTIELSQHAVKHGADAIAAIVPYFFTFDDESVYSHYKALGDALPDVPLFPYVFPGNAKNDISPALFKKLSNDIPTVAGIKSSNPDLIRLREYIRVGGDDLAIFCGVDGLMVSALVEGARGQVSGNANVFPSVLRAVYDNYQQGNIEAARAGQNQIDHIRYILHDGLHPAYFKTVLQRKNIIQTNVVRRPMRDLSISELEQLEAALLQLEKNT